MDRSICRALNLDRNEFVKVLSRSCQQQKHFDGSRIYQPNRRFKKLAQWNEEAVENLSRRNPKISMDRESVKIYQEKEKERLNRKESVEKLSSLKKEGFSRREKRIKMNAISKQLNERSNQHVKLSKHLSTK